MEDYLLSELNDFVDNKFTNQEYTTISVDNTNVFLFFHKTLAVRLCNLNETADFNEITKKYEEVKDILEDRFYDYTEFMTL